MFTCHICRYQLVYNDHVYNCATDTYRRDPGARGPVEANSVLLEAAVERPCCVQKLQGTRYPFLCRMNLYCRFHYCWKYCWRSCLYCYYRCSHYYHCCYFRREQLDLLCHCHCCVPPPLASSPGNPSQDIWKIKINQLVDIF